GLSTPPMPDHYVEKLAVLWEARATASWPELLVAATTLALLLLLPRVTKKIPAPLIAISFVAGSVALVHALVPSFSAATIGMLLHITVNGVEVAGIPSVLPSPRLPRGSDLSWHMVRDLLPSAFAIAMLGAIESLLSGVIADGITGTKHDPNSELVGLGVG